MREEAIVKDNEDAEKKQSNVSGEERVRRFFLETWGNIKAGFSTALIVFSGLLFFATFTWVVFAAVVWPAENAKYFRIPLTIDENHSLEVWGPTIIPGDQPFVEI